MFADSMLACPLRNVNPVDTRAVSRHGRLGFPIEGFHDAVALCCGGRGRCCARSDAGRYPSAQAAPFASCDPARAAGAAPLLRRRARIQPHTRPRRGRRGVRGTHLGTRVAGACRSGSVWVDLAADEVSTAIRRPARDSATGADWDRTPVDGNYNHRAALSVAVITIERATGSSPDHALLFHHGRYLGTTTDHSHAFIALDTARTTDDTDALRYKTPGSCNAYPDSTITTVRYHKDGDHVDILDPLPQ